MLKPSGSGVAHMSVHHYNKGRPGRRSLIQWKLIQQKLAPYFPDGRVDEVLSFLVIFMGGGGECVNWGGGIGPWPHKASQTTWLSPPLLWCHLSGRTSRCRPVSQSSLHWPEVLEWALSREVLSCCCFCRSLWSIHQVKMLRRCTSEMPWWELCPAHCGWIVSRLVTTENENDSPHHHCSSVSIWP